MSHTLTPQPAIAIPASAIRTNCCDAWWTGLKTAHCPACHETFTTTSAFDKHRTGEHHNDTRHCQPPAQVGLTDAKRPYPCWGHPTTDNKWTQKHHTTTTPTAPPN